MLSTVVGFGHIVMNKMQSVPLQSSLETRGMNWYKCESGGTMGIIHGKAKPVWGLEVFPEEVRQSVTLNKQCVGGVGGCWEVGMGWVCGGVMYGKGVGSL